MKNQINRISVVFIVIGFVMLGIGCGTDTSQNNQNSLEDQNVSNKEAVLNNKKTSTCNIEAIRNAVPGGLKKQLDRNFTLHFAENEKVLTIKGFVYGDFYYMQQLIDALDGFRSKECVRVISFQGGEDGSKKDVFKWCRNENCKENSTNQAKCNPAYINLFFKDSKIYDQISSDGVKRKLSKPELKGNEGRLELIGFVGDEPTSGKLSSVFEQLEKGVEDNCINKITFEPEKENETNMLLKQGFEWQICDPYCECYGECKPCPCVKKIDETNTNTNANNSNMP